MPQSLSNILIHLVFSTKNRMLWLPDEWRDDLHGYLGGTVRKMGSELLAVNSVEDHVHLLFPLPRTITVADLVKGMKQSSTQWIREKQGSKAFHWQTGYAAFSISAGHHDAVIQYIGNQREHHQKTTFQDEYRRLLKKCGISYDERYLWD